MNIQEIWHKCKSPEVVTAAIIILVGIGGFGLGRLSVLEQKAPITIDYGDTELAAAAVSDVGGEVAVASAQTTTGQTGQIVASKSGTKYYFPWCSGVGKIADKNKIWFASEAAARTAGYTPAANCKGLQ